MAFWGVEVKPGKPHTHKLLPLTTRRRLHISQATLGFGSSFTKSLLQCNIGDKSPILLCSLIPEKTESSSLHLEFEEEEVVILSVLGPRSIYLSGYYLDISSHTIDSGHETDSFGEDIGETESENSPREDDEYEDDFIDDGDIEVSPPARRYTKRDKSWDSVDVVEETDDDKPTNGNHKRLRKKYHVSDSDSDDPKRGPSIFDLESEDDDNEPTCVKDGASIFDSDSEDDKGSPHSSRENKNGKSEAKVQSDKTVLMGRKNNRDEDAGYQISGGSSRIEEVPDSETERAMEQRNDSHGKDKKSKKKEKRRSKRVVDDSITDVLKEDKAQIQEHGDDSQVRQETDAKLKKKKKKRAKEGQTGGVGDDDVTREELIDDEFIDKPSHDNEFESNGKLKKKKNKRVKEGQTRGEDNYAIEETKTVDIIQKEAKLSQANGLEHPEDNAENLKKKKKKKKHAKTGGDENDASRKDDISNKELTVESTNLVTDKAKRKTSVCHC